LGTDDLDEVRRNLEAALEEANARGFLKREPIWTESLAIGSAAFVERIKPLLLTRSETEVIKLAEGWSVLQEAPIPYGQECRLKSGPKNSN
jgi:hypothetical protein